MTCTSRVTADGRSKQKPLTVPLSRERMGTLCFDSLEVTLGMLNFKLETPSKFFLPQSFIIQPDLQDNNDNFFLKTV